MQAMNKCQSVSGIGRDQRSAAQGCLTPANSFLSWLVEVDNVTKANTIYHYTSTPIEEQLDRSHNAGTTELLFTFLLA
jgi:hypothetical protein